MGMQRTGTNLPMRELPDPREEPDLPSVTWIGDVPVIDEPHAWLRRRLRWERRLAELERGD